jgi:hypothetical protein
LIPVVQASLRPSATGAIMPFQFLLKKPAQPAGRTIEMHQRKERQDGALTLWLDDSFTARLQK